MAREDFVVEYPKFTRNRGAGFWLRPANWYAARNHNKRDNSREWRAKNEKNIPPSGPGMLPRTRSWSYLDLAATSEKPIRVIILGDPGDGDKSQHGLLPLIRSLAPDFMILNGDVAYPAGRLQDYIEGFFEPYNDLGIPIWAVPGNHEYYSPHQGREFVDVFCRREMHDVWDRYGLRFRPQPGTYWEISDPTCANVSIIGIDTGHSGNLDSQQDSDEEQIGWLKQRLTAADETSTKVILLFHIPALVNGQIDRKAKLSRLHEQIGSHKCVRAVICGHEHNYQEYENEVFHSALKKIGDVSIDKADAPRYYVSGGGGAYLSVPPFHPRPDQYKGEPNYPAEPPFRIATVFPNIAEWRQLIGGNATIGLWRSAFSRLRRTTVRTDSRDSRTGNKSLLQEAVSKARQQLAKSGLSKTNVDKKLAWLQELEVSDPDKASLLSLLSIEIWPNRTTITPVFLKELDELYDEDVTVVSIRNRNPQPNPDRVKYCERDSFTI
jgi:hypothetical protein